MNFAGSRLLPFLEKEGHPDQRNQDDQQIDGNPFQKRRGLWLGEKMRRSPDIGKIWLIDITSSCSSSMIA